MFLHILLILILSSTISPSEIQYENGNDANHRFNKLREDLMRFVKQLFDNSTDDLEARIEILENDVNSLELNFDVLQDEVIEIQTELVDVGSQLIGWYSKIRYIIRKDY